MQPIAFCNRCRGMKVGWNRRYLVHYMTCKDLISKSSKLLIPTVLASVLALAVSTPSAFVFSDQDPPQTLRRAALPAPPFIDVDPAIKTMDSFLEGYKIDGGQRSRIARAIVASSRKYNVDPLLVASIMIVESRANPFAISGSISWILAMCVGSHRRGSRRYVTSRVSNMSRRFSNAAGAC